MLSLVCFSCRYDERCHERFAVGDPSKRAFTYFVLTGGRFIYASALRLAVLKFILSMTVRQSPFICACLCLLTILTIMMPYCCLMKVGARAAMSSCDHLFCDCPS